MYVALSFVRGQDTGEAVYKLAGELCSTLSLSLSLITFSHLFEP